MDKIDLHKNHWTRFTGLETSLILLNFWHHKVAIKIVGRIGITRGVKVAGGMIGKKKEEGVHPQTAACSAGLFRVSRQPEGTPSASRAA